MKNIISSRPFKCRGSFNWMQPLGNFADFLMKKKRLFGANWDIYCSRPSWKVELNDFIGNWIGVMVASSRYGQLSNTLWYVFYTGNIHSQKFSSWYNFRSGRCDIQKSRNASTHGHGIFWYILDHWWEIISPGNLPVVCPGSPAYVVNAVYRSYFTLVDENRQLLSQNGIRTRLYERCPCDTDYQEG